MGLCGNSLRQRCWGESYSFLLPATFLAVLFSAAYRFVREPLAPLAALSPIQTFGGVGIAALMAVALIFFLCFLAGLVIRTAWAQRLLERFESRFLGKVPLYAFFRSMFSEMTGQHVKTGPDMALAWIEECWQPAAVMEELENGWLVVFVPQAPTPFSGAIFYMPPDRVKKIEPTSAEMLKSMARFGVGSRALLKGQL
jgi:uncharacterized membrane protein